MSEEIVNTVGIIGLGLIGGSMAKSVRTRTDHIIYGFNRNEEVALKALSEGVIDALLTRENAKECDMLIVSLMPEAVVSVINDYVPFLKKGCIVVDCTGIKSGICAELSESLNMQGIRFIGGHPMAGKEVAGYGNSDDKLFLNASMILCKDKFTDDDAFSEACGFFRSIGFPRIKETNAAEHDRVIAYTSQMAHVVSNAYVRSHTLKDRYGFSAGSFKDLTRVAKLNENMWTELFLENREPLLKELKEFMGHMSEYIDALENKDRKSLVRLLGEGRALKEQDEKKESELNGYKNS